VIQRKKINLKIALRNIHAGFGAKMLENPHGYCAMPLPIASV
jgi:hypothetical protein